MLKINGLSKYFQSGEVLTKAIDGISMSVGSGEFVAITGASGAGKSTLLNVLGLLENFNEGSYEINGTEVSKMGDRQKAQVRNENIGFIFQSFNLLPYLSVYENIELPLKIRGINKSERKKSVEQLLEKFGLANRAKHLPSQLSGGQQQRVSIARALSCAPKLILADEPTGNLNSEMANEVFSMFEEINREGTTILVVTHDEGLASRAHKTIQIGDGKVMQVS
ncbi:ABC transporter ATP-binding protein [Pseudoalteromonas byunsanensis]|uniref:ABC transporter ATP-binding protein n=1 Tax=Pseudoalteromonas byunsanensis TaxID=327939 RepID=A0A1S1N704_9GAMM|nr:ABC transporter ATP-binding protein [Pseudoalteromonas byunsanensis]OHU95198.1 ABC transporter ATP-binding protein [Pseudoalteromonas byunsanensis]